MDGIAALWPFSLPLLALLIAVIHIRWKGITGWQAIGTLLMWQLGVGLGLGSIRGGLGHLMGPDQVAASIGCQAGIGRASSRRVFVSGEYWTGT